MSNSLTNNKNVLSKLELVSYGFIAATVFGIHIFLLLKSQLLFNLLIACYIIAFSITVTIITDKYKTAYSNSDFSIIMYYSFFTMFLQLFIIILSYFILKNKSRYNYF